MITHEQAAKLKMGDKLIAYRNAHVRIGEATPVEFEPCVVLEARRDALEAMSDAVAAACGDKRCLEPRIMVAFHDGTTQLLRGGRLFLGMVYAHDAVEADIVDIGRMNTAIMAAWNAYFEAEPGHVDCPCAIEPRDATTSEQLDGLRNKAFEASMLDHVHEMACRSLPPEAFEALEKAFEQLRKNRHLG
jgi:hypothetical protein